MKGGGLQFFGRATPTEPEGPASMELLGGTGVPPVFLPRTSETPVPPTLQLDWSGPQVALRIRLRRPPRRKKDKFNPFLGPYCAFIQAS